MAGRDEAVRDLAGQRSRLVEASEARWDIHTPPFSPRAEGRYPTPIGAPATDPVRVVEPDIEPGAYAACASASCRVTRPRS